MTSRAQPRPASVSGSDGHRHMMLVRKHLAKPSHRAGQIQHRAQDADRHIGQQSGKDQRHAQRQGERPRCRRGQHDLGGLGVADLRFLVICITLSSAFRLAQRAIKYTTDSTTTQMASTKCQYMAKTPMRSACSCFT